MILDYCKNRVTLLIGGSISEYPSWTMIGSGSGVALASQTTLFNGWDRQEVTAVTYPTATKVKYQTDWNSVEVSGLQLREFGVTISGAGITGSMWTKSTLPAITFDGTNELRTEETIEIY